MSIRSDLEKRAQEAILKNLVENYKQQHIDLLKNPTIRKSVFDQSFYKLFNAFLIAFFIILFGLLGAFILPLVFGWSLWLSVIVALAAVGLGGGVIESAFLYKSLKDERAHASAVSELLKPQVNFNPDIINNKSVRAKVDKALEYWSLIDETINQVPQGVLRDRLDKTAQEVTHWLQAVYNLADRVDKFRLNQVIAQDLNNVPKAIKDYEKRLQFEDSPEVRRQLEKTIADKKRQLQTLQHLQDNMDKAAYQLESTISSLGTIYSQLLLVGSRDEEGSRINRLQEEISEQVHQLEDLTEAMDEVYRSSV